MTVYEPDTLNLAQQPLPPPILEQAQNGVLNPSDKKAVIKVQPYPGMTCGDKLLMNWAGLDADGLASNHQVARFVSEDRVGEEMIFAVGSAHIAALDGGSLEISYSLTSTRFAESVHSHRLQLSVGDVHSDLLPATVNDAVGRTLDPDRVKEGAIVTIKPYARMAAGDWVLLTWAGVSVEGSFSDALKVESFAVGGELSFWVSPECIAPNLGSSISVDYCVKQAGHGPRYSELTTLMIGRMERGPLPAPTVLEADEGWVDLHDAQDGVTVVIENAKAEKGELICLECDGEKFDHRDDREITGDTAGEPLVFIVPYSFWREHRDSTIRVSYSVERVDGTLQQSGVTPVQVQSLMGH
ncbi:hypothetical protein PS726_01573 [Pseudomonas fluorescens]|uniref:Uncharacterized protein n=1 Tax=Pseudomonas fluorescens TaxID=294 RepID=A0A8H2NMM6_PSEFL|nr:hypothetical protein [Pseudomonas fluorescens]VVN87269.1 hypothetical protein PS726_01573 [Pseudomonas fluorescens]VVO57562.1 hypothetical protein PS900_00622 [Pseudomonas fluorescens]